MWCIAPKELHAACLTLAMFQDASCIAICRETCNSSCATGAGHQELLICSKTRHWVTLAACRGPLAVVLDAPRLQILSIYGTAMQQPSDLPNSRGESLPEYLAFNRCSSR